MDSSVVPVFIIIQKFIGIEPVIFIWKKYEYLLLPKVLK